MKGDYQPALADVEQAMKLAPNDPTNRFTRGFVYRKKGDLDKAMADFNEVIRLDPEFGEVYRERGQAWAEKGDSDKAIADLNEAIKRVPDDYEAFFRRGCVYAAKGDLDKAIADYDAAIKLDPVFAEAHFNRALAFVAKEQPRQGPGRLPRSDPVGSANARRLQGLGTSRRQGKTREGRRSARRDAATGQARSADPFPARRRPCTKKANSTRPSPSTTRPWRCIPAIPRSTTTVGWPIARRTILAKAIADYTQAIRLDPKYIPAYANRGYVYYKLNDFERALADFDKILELDPNNADAKKSRDVILKSQSDEQAASPRSVATVTSQHMIIHQQRFNQRDEQREHSRKNCLARRLKANRSICTP